MSRNQLSGTVPDAVAALFPLTSPGWSSNCVANTTGRYANCDHPARVPLVDLYLASQGDTWTLATNWLSSTVSPCNWLGVSCVSDVVVSLSLPNNNVGGTLPGSLGALTNLTCVGWRLPWC